MLPWLLGLYNHGYSTLLCVIDQLGSYSYPRAILPNDICSALIAFAERRDRNTDFFVFLPCEYLPAIFDRVAGI